MYVYMYVCMMWGQVTPGRGGLVRSQAVEQVQIGDLISQLGLQFLRVGSLGDIEYIVPMWKKCMYVCMYVYSMYTSADSLAFYVCIL